MKRWILMLVLLLLAVSLACSVPGLGNLGDAGEVLDNESGDTGGGEVRDDGSDDSDDAHLEFDAMGMQNLQSYRSRIVYNWTGDDGSVQVMTMQQEEIRNPAARRTFVSAEENGESFTMETIQVGTTTWMNFGAGWMQSQDDSGDFEDMFGDAFFDSSEFSDLDEDQYQYLGRETLNDIRARHYRLLFSPALAATMTGGVEITDFNGEIWIADQSDMPDIVVRWRVEWTGEMEGRGSGRVAMDYEVYDINKSFTIEPPDEAEGDGLPADIPLYEDSNNLFSMPGFISFEVTDDVATVKAFYEQQLPANGWTLSEDNSFGDIATFTWTKEARTMTLVITTTDAGGASVLMTIEGE